MKILNFSSLRILILSLVTLGLASCSIDPTATNPISSQQGTITYSYDGGINTTAYGVHTKVTYPGDPDEFFLSMIGTSGVLGLSHTINFHVDNVEDINDIIGVPLSLDPENPTIIGGVEYSAEIDFHKGVPTNPNSNIVAFDSIEGTMTVTGYSNNLLTGTFSGKFENWDDDSIIQVNGTMSNVKITFQTN
jgi:hypothetical protein